MDNDLHFISGLPRAGSTLLSALLRQNPRFHAGMTSPVGTIVEAMLKATSMAHETSVFIDDRQRVTLLRGVFDTFHSGHPAGHVSFDTNRMWCAKLPLIARLYPKARVICCVRDVAAILNSIERLARANALQPSGIFGFDPGGTAYSRAEALTAGTGLVGYAWNALREAFHSAESDRLLIVTYESLARDPERTLRAIYAYLGKAPYAHDFENVVFDADAFDGRIGAPGLHRVGRTVRFEDHESVLPPDLVRKYSGDSYWLDLAANINDVPVV